MPLYRTRPLIYRPRRPFDLQQRAGLLLGTTGLVSDNFRDRATIATSNGFDGYGADKAWTAQSGAFSCSGGKLVCTSAGIVTVDPGVADAFRFEFALAFAPDGNNNRFLLRFVDVNNHMTLAITSSAAQFQKNVATTVTALGTATTGVTPRLGDVVIGSLVGNVFSAQFYRAGVAVGTAASVTDATHAGNTPVGFRSATTALAIGYLKVRRS